MELPGPKIEKVLIFSLKKGFFIFREMELFAPSLKSSYIFSYIPIKSFPAFREDCWLSYKIKEILYALGWVLIKHIMKMFPNAGWLLILSVGKAFRNKCEINKVTLKRKSLILFRAKQRRKKPPQKALHQRNKRNQMHRIKMHRKCTANLLQFNKYTASTKQTEDPWGLLHNKIQT